MMEWCSEVHVSIKYNKQRSLKTKYMTFAELFTTYYVLIITVTHYWNFPFRALTMLVG